MEFVKKKNVFTEVTYVQVILLSFGIRTLRNNNGISAKMPGQDNLIGGYAMFLCDCEDRRIATDDVIALTKSMNQVIRSEWSAYHLVYMQPSRCLSSENIHVDRFELGMDAICILVSLERNVKTRLRTPLGYKQEQPWCSVVIPRACERHE